MIAVLRIFALALTLSKILTFEIFDLENVGQGHGEQLLRRRHLIANMQMFKSRRPITNFVLALTVCEMLTAEEFDIENVHQDHGYNMDI